MTLAVLLSLGVPELDLVPVALRVPLCDMLSLDVMLCDCDCDWLSVCVCEGVGDVVCV